MKVHPCRGIIHDSSENTLRNVCRKLHNEWLREAGSTVANGDVSSVCELPLCGSTALFAENIQCGFCYYFVRFGVSANRGLFHGIRVRGFAFALGISAATLPKEKDYEKTGVGDIIYEAKLSEKAIIRDKIKVNLIGEL